MQDLLSQMVKVLTENEHQRRESIRGYRRSKRHQGALGGRPRVLTDAQAVMLRELVDSGLDKAHIARLFGISRASVYRYASSAYP